MYPYLSIYLSVETGSHQLIKPLRLGSNVILQPQQSAPLSPAFFSTPGQSTFSLLSESVIYLPVPYLSIASYFILKIAEHSPLCSNIFHWALSLAFLFPEILERQKHQFPFFSSLVPTKNLYPVGQDSHSHIKLPSFPQGPQSPIAIPKLTKSEQQ